MTDRPFELDDLSRVVIPTDTAISPDGTTVVYVRSETVDSETSTSLWAVSPGQGSRRLTVGPADSVPRFSPDGATIAFLRVLDGAPQVHLLPISGGEAETVTTTRSLPLGAGQPVWSPNGNVIAFSAVVQRSNSTDPHSPIVTDTLAYKMDGAGWLGARRRHLHIVDLQSKKIRRLTDGDWHADVPSWSPDGKSLAFTADLEPNSDLELSSCTYQIFLDEPGAAPRRVGHARSVRGATVWAPDGGSIIAMGTPEARLAGPDLIRLSVSAPETPADINLTAQLDRSVMPGAPGYPGGTPALSSKNTEVIFCLRDRGWTHLYGVDIQTGTSRPIFTETNEVISALSVATEAQTASVVVTTQHSFGEVAVVDLDSGAITTLTHLTTESLPEVALLAAEEREFSISDGRTVHGWLLSAPETEGPAPLLLDIHGGPHNAWSGIADAHHSAHQVLASQGWRVLTLNPRGSDGYGRDFMYAVNAAWGAADEVDFLEPIDLLITEGLVDADRLAVTGYSYGGFSTCHLTARTNRFAAAVAGGLICDLGAMAGVADFGNNLGPMATGVSVVDDAARLLAASPIARVRNVATPTLILHGKSDERCPLSQAEAWFSALRQQQVPTRLVAYPGASHAFPVAGSISHRIDYNARLIEWVERYTSTNLPTAGRSRAAAGSSVWQRQLEVLCERYGVTGAQFGILTLDDRGRELTRTAVATGLLNVDTGAKATTDALFQIGSITKVWTTMLVMQLVDEGLLDLDARVRSVLPGFTLEDEATAENLTIRSLLNHRNGIDGDLFLDMGRGDDAIERYVTALREVRQVHALDDGFSYSNSAFVVAGRIVEVLRGATWDAVLEERILKPLGLRHTVTLTDDVPRFSAAIGHTTKSVAMPVWPITRSMGPAGVIAASIGDLLTFAELALGDGTSIDGVQILTTESAVAMRTPSIDLSAILPDKSAWGLGWSHESWSGKEVFGHDGGTIGQRSFLRIFPEHKVAIALLTTGGQAEGLYRDLFSRAASELVGLQPPAAVSPTTNPAEPFPDASLGKYRSGGTELEIRCNASILEVVVTDLTEVIPDPESSGGKQRAQAESKFALEPSQIPGIWTARPTGSASWVPVRPHRDGVYLGTRFLPRRRTLE